MRQTGGVLLILTLVLLACQARTADTTDHADPAWFTCHQDTDCQVTSGLCADFTAVNRNHLSDYETFRQHMMPRIECARVDRPVPPLRAACQQQRCVLEWPNHYRPGGP